MAYCREINQRLESLVVAIVSSIKNVSPRIFAQELRVYWESIEIGGQKYDGAGAAQLPICLIDHFLWASDRSDSIYQSYYEHTIHYIAYELRKLYATNLHRPSLVTEICAELAHRNELTPLQKDAVQEVYQLFAILIKFRQPHKKLANVTYAERYKIDPAVVGSSGHSPEILSHILNLTWQAREYLKQHYDAPSHVKTSMTPASSSADKTMAHCPN